jgi:oligopeptide/dipeptide ABC transporter ATP-binding protein
MSDLLRVAGLTISFPRRGDRREDRIEVVRDLSLDLGRGEFVGLVGESGSGKSLTALAVLRLLPPAARIDAGSIELEGLSLLDLPEEAMRPVRGGRVAMVFQEPMTALNPVLTIGFQVAEAVRAHADVTRAEAREEARRLLELVAIPRAAERVSDYPHQLSGGQRQRAMIAMALAGEPQLLIADEPTTALDVTIQAQILDLLLDLRDRLGLTVLLITHDLGVVAETCDRALVMYAGRIVERASVAALFGGAGHPYTQGLLAAQPDLASGRLGTQLPTIPGQIPDPAALPTGCAFHPRCPEAMDRCSVESPPGYRLAEGHEAACFLHAPEPAKRHAAG